MVNEENLAEQFNQIIGGFCNLCEKFQIDFPEWDFAPQERKIYFYAVANSFITQLENTAIHKVKLEEAIQRILKKIEEDVRGIISNTQLNDTERKIQRHLGYIKVALRDKKPPRWFFVDKQDENLLNQLVRLQVSENDLLEARKRTTRIMKQLVSAAEKLE